MELNGVNSGYAAYEAASVSSKSATGKSTSTTTKDGKTTTTNKESAYTETAAIYEKSSVSAYATNSKADRSAIDAQLKADADNRMKQMQIPLRRPRKTSLKMDTGAFLRPLTESSHLQLH